MNLHRRPPPATTTNGAVATTNHHSRRLKSPSPSPKASDALPLYLTNTIFFSVAYYLLHRWRDKIRRSTPVHVVTLSEIAAIVSVIASFIYLLS
ncbi:unnamed protein product [Trifolium pratense]|uniref:Uncharacterized protein n=1 Tax=Trifolium pratense TaxID=57577 RepID=A0ACB0KDC3_TRIPR|nr:unnamed protein product [Trifolium pratense]